MDKGASLHDHLDHLVQEIGLGVAPAEVIKALAGVSADLSDMISLGSPAGQFGLERGTNAGGDSQKALDVQANDMFRTALLDRSVAAFASEEADDIEILDPQGSVYVAIDPIDGSGNIDINMPLGTIFSILPATGGFASTDGRPPIWPAGTRQCAAGFVLYGPQTTIVLATEAGVDLLTLDPRDRTFRLTRKAIRIPSVGPDDYAINASNYRHWEEPVRSFIDECLAGATGSLGRDFNMRWHGALVAEAHRIVMRGGLYLYPADARPGYGEGRLRLVYEAFPMAFILEAAGGAASDGRRRILDVEAKTLHQRVPLIFGSKDAVDRVTNRHHRSSIWPETTSPLFASRGLFRS